MSDNNRISDRTKSYDWGKIERELESIYGNRTREESQRMPGAKPQDNGGERQAANLKRNHRKLLWQAVVLAVLAAASLKYMPLFNLDEIKVVGNSYVTTEEVCRMAGVYRGQHILAVSPDEAKVLLLKDLRIERAEVKRLLPNGLMIQVTERQPVLNIPCDYGFIDIDREGMVLAAYRAPSQLPIPQLVGMKVRDLYISDSVREQPIKDMATFLGFLGPKALASLAYVNMSDQERILCLTPDRTEIRLGKLENLEEKARICRDFLAELKLGKQPMEYIDLSFGSPFVKPQRENSQPVQYRTAVRPEPKPAAEKEEFAPKGAGDSPETGGKPVNNQQPTAAGEKEPEHPGKKDLGKPAGDRRQPPAENKGDAGDKANAQ